MSFKTYSNIDNSVPIDEIKKDLGLKNIDEQRAIYKTLHKILLKNENLLEKLREYNIIEIR